MVTWDPKLAVGVRLIDRQHQELFRQVDRLLGAMEARRGRDEVARILAFLQQYVVDHFAAEERLMAAHRYPQAAGHRQQHGDFVKALLALGSEFEEAGPTTSVAVNLNRVVCGWLRQHIGTADLSLGRFLASQGQADAVA